MFDNRISVLSKLVYSMITGYTRGSKKKCFATDEHFMKSLCISGSTLQRQFRELEKFGLIKRKKDNDGRYITITWKT